ncbi:MAG: hypothetical protein K2P95_04195 [Hyphomonadaceae bacterium]|nr:hypothetical protein [Hyphomonadaceae bacterium]
MPWTRLKIFTAAVLWLSACQSAARPEQTATPIESPVLVSRTVMVGYAATDFKKHVAPSGTEFRNVRVGVRTQNGVSARVLCGEFRALPGFVEWSTFGTLQTDPFENWLGESHVCNPAYTILDNDDLTDELVARYAAS